MKYRTGEKLRVIAEVGDNVIDLTLTRSVRNRREARFEPSAVVFPRFAVSAFLARSAGLFLRARRRGIGEIEAMLNLSAGDCQLLKS